MAHRTTPPSRGYPTAESPLLNNAAAALAANRLTEPPGDNALELYLQAQARNPGDSIARAGIAEVRERLLATAENALLEERLDEAAAAIETARKSGVESGRIAFLTAQLGKSREQVKAAQAAVHARNLPKAETDAVSPLLDLAAQRSNAAHLIEPAQDSALYYVKEALRLDPGNGAVQEAKQTLAIRLLTGSARRHRSPGFCARDRLARRCQRHRGSTQCRGGAKPACRSPPASRR